MNKELKKQVIQHGNSINDLQSEILRIKNVLFPPTHYEIRCECTNCNRSQYMSVPMGELRPKTFKCNKCQCEVDAVLVGW